MAVTKLDKAPQERFMCDLAYLCTLLKGSIGGAEKVRRAKSCARLDAVRIILEES